MTITDWLGFIGVFQILLAYFLNAIGKITSKSLIFILLNLLGASMAFLASILIRYLPFVILEGVWALVSIVLLFKYLKNSRKH